MRFEDAGSCVYSGGVTSLLVELFIITCSARGSFIIINKPGIQKYECLAALIELKDNFN